MWDDTRNDCIMKAARCFTTQAALLEILLLVGELMTTGFFVGLLGQFARQRCIILFGGNDKHILLLYDLVGPWA